MENRNLSINSSWNLALLTSCLCSYRKVQTKEVICKTSTLTFIYQFIIIGISQVVLKTPFTLERHFKMLSYKIIPVLGIMINHHSFSLKGHDKDVGAIDLFRT